MLISLTIFNFLRLHSKSFKECIAYLSQTTFSLVQGRSYCLQYNMIQFNSNLNTIYHLKHHLSLCVWKIQHSRVPYRGNFGSRKVWQIHCISTLVEENLANCEILQVKISRKTYSVKHSEHLHHTTNLWRKPCCDARLCSSFTNLKPLTGSQNQIWC